MVACLSACLSGGKGYYMRFSQPIVHVKAAAQERSAMGSCHQTGLQ